MIRLPFFRRKPKPPRDESGRFVSAHHQKVIAKAQQMRAEMPGHVWRHQLPAGQ